jgi:hypothetical protein
MVEKGELEALAVCSPMEYHQKHLEIALEAGLHTFCEKPLLCSSRETKGTDSLAERAARLERSFAERGLVLHQNTQWTFVWDDIRELLGERALRKLQSFAMILAPANPGDSMFWEAVPHPVSMIVALGALGLPRAIRVEWSRNFSSLEIRFEVSCRTTELLHVGIALRAHAEQPRPCRLLLDGVRLDREVISLSPYALGLRRGPHLHSIVDPVRRSVNRFLASIRSRTPEAGDTLARHFQMLEALWAATLTPANVIRENAQPV